ncbi:MAG TPA: glycosyltransferase, partial [Terriglobales bacterium]|nr:glycosyltransferase [Terriglobales bacterium]
LRDRVIFLGKQDRVADKLGIADLMLLPSELESFGLAALEAMACEVPTVATRVGGVPEVVEHGETGYLAHVGDIDEMARCAIDILSDESRLRAMGRRAREVAEDKFSAAKIIPLYEGFYREMIAAG